MANHAALLTVAPGQEESNLNNIVEPSLRRHKHRHSRRSEADDSKKAKKVAAELATLPLLDPTNTRLDERSNVTRIEQEGHDDLDSSSGKGTGAGASAGGDPMLSEHADGTTSFGRTRRRRSCGWHMIGALSAVCCWRIPLSPMRLFPLLILLAGAAGVAALFRYYLEVAAYDLRKETFLAADAAGEPPLPMPPLVYQWVMFYSGALVVLCLALFTAAMLYRCTKRASAGSFTISRVFIYIKPAVRSSAVFVFAMILFPLSRWLLPSIYAGTDEVQLPGVMTGGGLFGGGGGLLGWTPGTSNSTTSAGGSLEGAAAGLPWTPDDLARAAHEISIYLDYTFTALALVAGLRMIVSILTQMVLLSMRKTMFWKQIFDYLTREKILQILARPPAFARDDSGGDGASADNNSKSFGASAQAMFSSLPMLIGHVAQSVKEDVLSSDEPTQSDFRLAWKNVLKRRVLGVLPAQDGQQQAAVAADGGAGGPTPDSEVNQAAMSSATEIFQNVAGDKEHFDRADITPFFERKVDADKCFALFNRVNSANPGVVTLENVAAVLGELFRERESLFRTVVARESLGGLLRRIIDIVFWLVMIFVVMAAYRLPLDQLLLPAGTSLLAVSFVFSNSLRAVWESFLAIFVIRSFDVGDRITLEGFPTLVVDRISLLSTTCHATDGRQFIIPNNTLFSTVITSYKRSTYYVVNWMISLPGSTTAAQIAELNERIYAWLREDQKNAPWVVEPGMTWVKEQKPMEGTITFEFWGVLTGITWQTPSKFLPIKSRLLMAVGQMLSDMNVVALPPLQPIKLVENDKDYFEQFYIKKKMQ